ncbi:MAG TPA: hypothetical protein VJ299_14410, partial [Steroidobacteraceae bacterium]|nr:hypothetical protein [Steroidobacteraceae bacterium]
MKIRQAAALLLLLTTAAHAQTPQFAIDPWWPRPLPERWITGRLGGVCVDGHDHVIVTNRRSTIRPARRRRRRSAPTVLAARSRL